MVVRAAGARAAHREADREPGLLRDGCAAGALADPRADRPRKRRRRRDVRHDRCGADAKDATHAGAVLENVAPYRVGRHSTCRRSRRQLGFPVSFTPHLLPVRRGLIATCNVRSHRRRPARSCSRRTTRPAPSSPSCPRGSLPELARVQGTDGAEIGVFEDAFTERTIVVCAIDNLGKGAAGQAVQNVNLLFGLRGDDGPAADRRARLDVRHRREGVRGGRRRGGHPPVRSKPDVALVRSIDAGGRRGDVDVQPRPGCARHRLAAGISPRPQPQAVVVNAGVANAATGAAGRGGRGRDRRVRRRRCSGVDAEQVVVLSTGVIGAQLPLDRSCSTGVASAVTALSAGRRRAAAERDPHDRLRPEGWPSSRSAGSRSAGWRKGAGMIHPLPRDHARRRHDRLPARRRVRPTPSCGRRSSGASTGSRSTATARRTTPWCCSRTVRAGATPATTLAFRAAPRRRSAPTSPGRSSLTARARPSCSRSTSTAPPRTTRPGDRAPGRHLAARQDRRLRARPELGPRARRGRLGALQRRLRPARPRPTRRLLRRHAGLRDGAPTGAVPGVGGRRVPDRARPRPRRRARPPYLASDLSYDYVRINAEYTT